MTWDSQDNNSTEVQYFWIAWIELWLLISLLSSGSIGTLNSSSMTRHATGMSRRVIVNHGRGSMAWEGATRRMLPKWPCHFKIRCRSSRCQTQGTTRRSHWRDTPGRTTRSTGQASTDCWNWKLFPSSDPHHHFRCHWHDAFGESGQNLECFEDRMSPKICQSWAWERRAWASSLAWLNSSWSQEFTGSTSFLKLFLNILSRDGDGDAMVETPHTAARKSDKIRQIVNEHTSAESQKTVESILDQVMINQALCVRVQNIN